MVWSECLNILTNIICIFRVKVFGLGTSEESVTWHDLSALQTMSTTMLPTLEVNRERQHVYFQHSKSDAKHVFYKVSYQDWSNQNFQFKFNSYYRMHEEIASYETFTTFCSLVKILKETQSWWFVTWSKLLLIASLTDK